MIRSRFTYNGKHLTKEDFLPKDVEGIEERDYGFGVDWEHYFKVVKVKKQLNLIDNSSDIREQYDCREGYYIDGSKIETKIHKYHNYTLYDIEENFYYKIDVVKIVYYYGLVLQFSIRPLDSKSHKIIKFENINSKSPEVLREVEKNSKRYKLIPKVSYIRDVKHIYNFMRKNSHLFKYNLRKDTFKAIGGSEIKIRNNRIFVDGKHKLSIELYDDLFQILDYV